MSAASIDFASLRQRGFCGVRLIGDVHGEAQAFAAATVEGRAAGRFIVQLGDLVDRGPDSPGTLRQAIALVDQGIGVFLRSNHDDKLARYLKGNPVRIGNDLAGTIEAIEKATDVARLKEHFLGAFDAAPWWLVLGKIGGDRLICVHGAFHPAMLDAPAPNAGLPRRIADKCRWLALYGEGRPGSQGADLPERTYGWIDTIPAGVTVAVGHDVISTEAIVERRNSAGGRVLFCDTGAGKGGRLSWIDLDCD